MAHQRQVLACNAYTSSRGTLQSCVRGSGGMRVRECRDARITLLF
jgi:hypothetical protein